MNISCFRSFVAVLIGTVLFSCSLAAAAPAKSAHEVRSPDGKIAVTILTDAPLGYSITVDGKPLLVRSRLGLELAGDVKLGEKPVVQSEKRRSANTSWVNEWGKNRNVRDHFNELNLTLKEGDRTFGVVARAYNDGAAFRLVLPKQPGMDSFTVTRDATELHLPRRLSGLGGLEQPGGRRPPGGRIRWLAGMVVRAQQAFRAQP